MGKTSRNSAAKRARRSEPSSLGRCGTFVEKKVLTSRESEKGKGLSIHSAHKFASQPRHLNLNNSPFDLLPN